MRNEWSPKSVFGDIRFWIFFCFLIRLYAITNPPLEVGHNWRQTDGLMIARNFYEKGPDLLHPQVDLGGERTGIVGCEFPILNYLIYIASVVFGYEHWYGRLIVLVTSSIGVFYFFKTVSREFGARPAFFGALLLMFSFWFSNSRKIIPDAFAISLCLVALYHALRYLDDGIWWRLAIFLVLGSLGCLSKISAGVVLTVVAFPLLRPAIPVSIKVKFILASGVILMSVIGWYFMWVPYLNDTYGFGDHFFMGLTFSEGGRRIMENIPGMLKRLYDTPMKYTGFAAFLFAIAIVIRNGDRRVILAFAFPFLAYMVILVKTGTSVLGDTYYVLAMIVPMAFITGCGLAYLNNTKIAVAIVAIVAVENVAAQIYDFRIKEPFKSFTMLEGVMDEVSKRDDRIAISGLINEPTAMYFAHRKGWVAEHHQLENPDFVKDMQSKGCRFVVILRKKYGEVSLSYPVVHDSENFKVYKLE